MARIELVTEQRRGNMARLLEQVDQDDFWSKTRYGQIVQLLDLMGVFHITQTDIANVMDVSNNLVTRFKKYHRDHPHEERKTDAQASSVMFLSVLSTSSTRETPRDRPSRWNTC